MIIKRAFLFYFRWGAVLAILAGLGACGGAGATGSTASGTGGGTPGAGGTGGGGAAGGTGGAGAAGGGTGATGGSTGGGGTGAGGSSPCNCIAGNACVGGACKLLCDSHLDCETGIEDCTPAKADETSADIMVCQPNGKPAGFGAPCPLGVECAAPVSTCHSAGEGDADAYCTKYDCQTDVDCPGGYMCGLERDPHAICGAVPPKGDNATCGTTTEACINPATFGQGNTLFEGSVCILRKICLKRGGCAPCASDLDCSHHADHHCVSAGGELRCAKGCGADGDCLPADHCVTGACVPRFGGGCKGTGKFCEPCQSDEDCGTKGTSLACASVSGYERACVDVSYPDTCTSNADCPKSPSGKNGSCLDESFGLSPGDVGYHRCYFPYYAATNEFSCW